MRAALAIGLAVASSLTLTSSAIATPGARGVAASMTAGLSRSMTGPIGYPHRMPRPTRLIVHKQLNPECDGSACADPDTGEIWIGKRPDRFHASHEIGHVFFRLVADSTQRAQAQALLGFDASTPWENGTGDHGDKSPDEIAADAYAACDLGYSPAPSRAVTASGKVVLRVRWPIAYGYLPTAREHRRFCALVEHIGR
jgi:hypothetical protein